MPFITCFCQARRTNGKPVFRLDQRVKHKCVVNTEYTPLFPSLQAPTILRRCACRYMPTAASAASTSATASTPRRSFRESDGDGIDLETWLGAYCMQGCTLLWGGRMGFRRAARVYTQDIA